MHDLTITEKAPKVKAIIEATHFAMEKIYGLSIHCRRAYELRSDDFTISTLSFLKLSPDEVLDKETMIRIMRDLELLMKPLSEKLSKIKSKLVFIPEKQYDSVEYTIVDALYYRYSLLLSWMQMAFIMSVIEFN